jgi:phytanoyl-CoA hydroxylase
MRSRQRATAKRATRPRRRIAFDAHAPKPHPLKTTGYLAIPNFATPEEVQALRSRAQELVAGADLTTAAASVFSTVRQQKKVHDDDNAPATAPEDDDRPASSDRHFLDSAGKVSFFLEEKAVDPQTGAVNAPRESAVNKIGHALHDCDATFRAFSRSERVASLLRSLGYAKPLPVQSMYIVKGPIIGGEVSPHRDDSFLATQPKPSVVGLWLALENADRSNGCLWAVPGSQNDGNGEPERRFVLRGEGGAEGTPSNKKLAFTAPQPDYDLSSAKPIECAAGTLVLLHGHVLHYSGENTSPVSRHSYAAHYVEGGKGLKWAEDNWLQRDEGFEALYCDD